MAITTKVPAIETYSPASGRIIGEDGLLYNIVDLLAGSGGGGGQPGPPGISVNEKISIGTYGRNALYISQGSTIILANGSPYTYTTNAIFGSTNLDTGVFEVGSDYYIHVGAAGVILLSLASAPPSGYRNVGGFHFGVIRTGTLPAAVNTGIVTRSVWTFQDRPNCNPQGMVRLSGNLWVDIYLSSDDGNGGLTSKYLGIPVSGTESLNWYAAVDRLAKVGKRPLTYSEFVVVAAGSPPGTGSGNENAWSSASERAPAGFVQNAVSNVGCRDCVGNLWEWQGDIIASGIGETPAWFDPMSAYGQGQVWLNAANDFRAVLAGGSYFNGALIGARSVCTLFSPWNDNPSFGVRGACESTTGEQTYFVLPFDYEE